jgi:hypothetical protein
MSRSRKKPYLKDHPEGIKKIAARMYRRRNKQITKVWAKGWTPWDVEYLYADPEYPHRWIGIGQYSICDWIWYQPNEPKYYRK